MRVSRTVQYLEWTRLKQWFVVWHYGALVTHHGIQILSQQDPNSIPKHLQALAP